VIPSALDQPYNHAIARLGEVGGDIAALPIELQTLLLVESAHSIIESGGLDFFYDADFPNNPPYTAFAEAYRRIGADAAADCIEASSLMFPFAEPQLFEPLRQLWLEKFRQSPGGEFDRLDSRIRADETVWDKLAAYVHAHRAAFGPGR
jgi:hypothetical protein